MTLFKFCVVAPLLHRYVNGDVPLMVDVVMLPSALPQLAGVGTALIVIACDGLTVVVAMTVHPAASVTVTSYVPAARFVMFCAVDPLLQL